MRSLNGRGGVIRRLLISAVACAVALLAAGCGADKEEVKGGITAIQPTMPQRLAFATANRVGVVEGRHVRYLESVPARPGAETEALTWSADGRSVAWVRRAGKDLSKSVLTIVDPKTGERNSWDDVYGPVFPGTAGVVALDSGGRFSQYFPDGSMEELSVKVAPPAHRESSLRPETYVAGVVPSVGAWLVEAESSERMAMPADSFRLFEFDPQHPSMVPLGNVPVGGFNAPVRLDDHQVAWIDVKLVGTCRNSDRLDGYRVRAPSLPTRSDARTWQIRRVFAKNGEINVLARGTGPRHPDRPGSEEQCVRGDGSYRWLAYRDGSWTERGSGLLEVDIADDGRVARVNGEVCPLYPRDEGCEPGSEGEYQSLRWGASELEFPHGPPLALPSGVRMVRFSPDSRVTIRRVVGRGPALTANTPLDPDAFGAMRLGATPAQIQSATRTPLRLEGSGEDCEIIEPADAGIARELGVKGIVAEGHLTAVRATTLDVPADEYDPPLSEQQPDVSKVKSRGPRTSQGVRAGDDANRLFDAYGNPDHTDVVADGKTAYSFELGEVTLNAIVDGAAVVRELEFRSGDGGEPCGG